MPSGEAAAASAHHNLATLLARSAASWPRLPALALGAATLADYASFARAVRAMAAGLRERGLAPGDRVALVARNQPQYVEALFACWWAGLVAVPVNAKLHLRELEYVLDHSGARLAFVDAAWAAALGGAALAPPLVELGSGEAHALARTDASMDIAPVRPGDAAWLFYTSGTTGRPKGVVISHGNLRAMAYGYLADVASVSPGDALLHPAPLSHGSGLYLLPYVARAACSVLPESGGFEADEILALIAHHRGCAFFAAPTMVKRLVDAPGIGSVALDHLECIVLGGGPLYVEDARAAFGVFGPRIAQIYGQGESPMTITAMDRALFADAARRGDDARLGSVGIAQGIVEVRVGTAEEALDPGAIGEVLVRGATVMQGYWRNPEATAATLAGGWLHTGDLGVFDDDGFLTLKDRSKDLIISGGSNIYPREVEEVLLRHPDVREAAVVGRRHAEWGEEVVAYIVVRREMRDEPALVRALDALCLASIARFKRPRDYRFVDELPKNNAGKVLKTALREVVAGDPGAAPAGRDPAG
jgi:long-chain acyl-CoA synthetase